MNRGWGWIYFHYNSTWRWRGQRESLFIHNIHTKGGARHLLVRRILTNVLSHLSKSGKCFILFNQRSPRSLCLQRALKMLLLSLWMVWCSTNNIPPTATDHHILKNGGGHKGQKGGTKLSVQKIWMTKRKRVLAHACLWQTAFIRRWVTTYEGRGSQNSRWRKHTSKSITQGAFTTYGLNQNSDDAPPPPCLKPPQYVWKNWEGPTHLCK